MRRRGGSLNVCSLHFYSVAARCLLWHTRIMRREEGRYHRGEDEERKEGKGTESKGRINKESELDQQADFI